MPNPNVGSPGCPTSFHLSFTSTVRDEKNISFITRRRRGLFHASVLLLNPRKASESQLMRGQRAGGFCVQQNRAAASLSLWEDSVHYTRTSDSLSPPDVRPRAHLAKTESVEHIQEMLHPARSSGLNNEFSFTLARRTRCHPPQSSLRNTSAPTDEALSRWVDQK